MKNILVFLTLGVAFALLPFAAFCQYAGDYGTADTTLFQILQRTDGLYFATEHYGNIRMLADGKGRFTLDRVKPVISIEFDTSSTGQVNRLLLHQAGTFTWVKDTPSISLAGSYHQDIDPSLHIHVRQAGDRLLSDTTPMRLVGKDQYKLADARLDDSYHFKRDRKGMVQRMVVSRTGIQVYLPRQQTGPRLALRAHAPDRHLGFTRADTLEGAPLPARTCYDVLFYDLDAAIDPSDRSIRGRNRIRFRAVRDLDSIQVDLYANLRIDSILYRGSALRFHREYNAVYVAFPSMVQSGNLCEIEVFYQGRPILPDPSVMQGGIIWFRDAKGKPWVESVCQGSGGSLWWPGKDLLSDKPDSMRIALTVPAGLTGISNGRLVDTSVLPDGRERSVWYVSSPILNYDVAFYIGDYMHWRDSSGIDYYCMPYSEEKARKLFAGVPAVMQLYTADFGPYPFARDGFKLIESPYPMEHQGAVTPGPITPLGDGAYDTAEVTMTMWHEIAHEWWGNNVSCADYADLWIHESFASYAEELCYDAFQKGHDRYLRHEEPANKEPIIGVPNVNYFYLGDMYSKGARMLHMLRNIIGNDPVWFGALGSIQRALRYGSVTTNDVVQCFTRYTGKDHTIFFDQYLRYSTIPVLQWQADADGMVRYRWRADVPGFSMPVKLRSGQMLFVTDQWKEVRLPEPLTLDMDAYCVRVEQVK